MRAPATVEPALHHQLDHFGGDLLAHRIVDAAAREQDVGVVAGACAFWIR